MVLFSFSLVCLVSLWPPIATAQDQDIVAKALKAIKLSPGDLHIKADYAADRVSADGRSLRLSTVKAALERPLELDAVVAQMTEALSAGRPGRAGMPALRTALQEAAARLDLTPVPVPEPQVLHANAPLALALDLNAPVEFDPYGPAPPPVEGLPPALRRAAARLVYAVRRCADRQQRARRDLTDDQLAWIASRLPAIVVEEEPITGADALAALNLAAGVSLQELVVGAMGLAAAVEEARQDLAATRRIDAFMQDQAARRPILFEQDTPFGGIVIAGTGPNEFRRLPAILIDLGGDDEYLPEPETEWAPKPPVSVIVDCAGDDLYLASSSFEQGGAVLGISLLVDESGDDIYLSRKHFAQGAGVCGVGLLWDHAGNDRYAADTFCQGAGFFGIGLLIDDDGSDQYEAALMGQGFGCADGFGALVDGSGHDRYSAGGRYPDRARGAGRFVALSQGAGLGIRPLVSGGIGVLVDSQGDDTYTAGNFCQGSGRWYGLGVLTDCAGDDVYVAGDESQAAGAALGVGVLRDGQGDDAYRAERTTQGAGLDLGVGLLFDHGGNDHYQADTQTQGAGISNGIGVLRDTAGDDQYQASALCQGYGDAGRGYGSVGLLIDEAGWDGYSGQGRDDLLWTAPKFGLGLDVGRRGVEAVAAQLPMTTGRRLPGVQWLGQVPTWPTEVDPAVEAQVDELRDTLVRAASQAQRDQAARALEAIGERAAPALAELLRAGEEHVAGLAGEVLVAIGPDAAPAVLTVAESGDLAAARRAMHVLARIGDPRAEGLLIAAVHQPDWRTRAAAASALALTGGAEAVRALVYLLQDPDEDVRRSAVVSLGRCQNGAAARDALVSALADTSYGVRNAAADAIVNIGLSEPTALRDLFVSPRPEVRYLAVETAGRACSREGIELMRELLNSDDWGDRAFAAEALCRLGDPKDREQVRQMKEREPSGFVVMKAEAALNTIGYCAPPRKGDQ